MWAGGGAGAVEIVAGAVTWAGAATTGAARAVARAANNCCGGSCPRSEGSGYIKTSSTGEDAMIYRIKLVYQRKLGLLRSLVMDGNP